MSAFSSYKTAAEAADKAAAAYVEAAAADVEAAGDDLLVAKAEAHTQTTEAKAASEAFEAASAEAFEEYAASVETQRLSGELTDEEAEDLVMHYDAGEAVAVACREQGVTVYAGL